jgi:hypothetical protein
VGAVVVACGSTTSNNPPGSGADGGGSDSGGANNGGDASDASSTADSGQDSAPSCVIGDADISTLSPPDASLNDAGASVGACIGCAKTNCSTDVAACNTDCECNTALVCIFECIGGVGNTLLTCAEQCGGLANVDGAEETLLGCAEKSCKAECGQGGGGTKPTDAGGQDGSDLDGSDVDAADAN